MYFIRQTETLSIAIFFEIVFIFLMAKAMQFDFSAAVTVAVTDAVAAAGCLTGPPFSYGSSKCIIETHNYVCIVIIVILRIHHYMK